MNTTLIFTGEYHLKTFLKHDTMKNELIMSLSQFAKLINESDEWLLYFDKIMLANGWYNDTGANYDICSTDKERLSFNEQSEAIIYPIN